MSRSTIRYYKLFSVIAAASLLFSVMAQPSVYGLTASPTTSSGSGKGSGSSGGGSSGDSSEKLSSLKDDYEKLEAELNSIKKNLDSITDEKQRSVAEQNNISTQIAISQKQIKLLEEKIQILDEQIAQKEEEITTKQKDIDENFELFKVRIRALYMTDTSSVMNVLFGAQSFSEFLERSEYIKRVTEHDDALIAQLKSDKADVEAAKAEIDAAKGEMVDSKAQEAEKKEQLDGQYAKLSTEVALLKKTEAEYNANKAAIEQDMKEAEAEINKIYSQMQSIGEYVGGEFGWPLPGYSSISSYYGLRFGGSDFHTGIDITGSGVYGATIVAANSGKVSFVQTTYTAGKGYGKYVIIDHGGGKTTLYGHMSTVTASLGDWVTKGDKIGEVGATGWATGPHLHFEIRINGKHTNPFNYFTKR